MIKPVPGRRVLAARSRQEAETLIAEIGDLERGVALRTLSYSEDAAKLKEAFEADVSPLNDKLQALRLRVRGWCDVERESLVRRGGKSAKLATGRIEWKAGRRRIEFTLPETVIIAAMKRLGLAAKFVTTSESLNKNAMLADAALAETIEGVTVVAANEDFYVKPFDPEVADHPAQQAAVA